MVSIAGAGNVEDCPKRLVVKERPERLIGVRAKDCPRLPAQRERPQMPGVGGTFVPNDAPLA